MIKITIECQDESDAVIVVNSLRIREAIGIFYKDYLVDAKEAAIRKNMGVEPVILDARNRFEGYFKGLGIFR